jgi:hypothetical protein
MSAALIGQSNRVAHFPPEARLRQMIAFMFHVHLTIVPRAASRTRTIESNGTYLF